VIVPTALSVIIALIPGQWRRGTMLPLTPVV
jgi:hypothetical protein